MNPAFTRTLGCTVDDLVARRSSTSSTPMIAHRPSEAASRGGGGRSPSRTATAARTAPTTGLSGPRLRAWSQGSSMPLPMTSPSARGPSWRSRGSTTSSTSRAANLERQNLDLERLVDMNRALLDASVDGIRLSGSRGPDAARELRESCTISTSRIRRQADGRAASPRPPRDSSTRARIWRLRKAIAADPEITTSDYPGDL